jgi:hypothetical protein
MGILSGTFLVGSVVARFVFQPTPFPLAPVVSDLNLSHSRDELLPGDEVEIWVNVNVGDPKIPVVYTWNPEGGEIIKGQKTAEITYKAPDTPGTYGVSLKVEYGDSYTEKSTSIVVVSATPTLPPTITPTPTNTPLPSDTPTPTNTPTLILTGTLPPPETPTPKPDALVSAKNLNLRSGPGVVYDILGMLKQGDSLKVTARNLAGDWLKVIAPGGEEGWVAASLLEIDLPLADIPVVTQAPPTPTPVATPTPTLLPPPILIEPEDGATFIGGPVILKWQWDYRPRAPDEIFSLRVRREGETEPCHHYQPRDLEYWGDLFGYCSEGKHYWGVTLIRELCTDCPEEERWQDLSEPSEERWFHYVPGEEPWTWPTPDSGDDDDGPPMP